MRALTYGVPSWAANQSNKLKFDTNLIRFAKSKNIYQYWWHMGAAGKPAVRRAAVAIDTVAAETVAAEVQQPRQGYPRRQPLQPQPVVSATLAVEKNKHVKYYNINPDRIRLMIDRVVGNGIRLYMYATRSDGVRCTILASRPNWLATRIVFNQNGRDDQFFLFNYF